MMGTIIFDVFLLSVILVFIVDISGVVGELEKGMAKWLNVKAVPIPKPFSCSLCLSFWGGLIYLLCTSRFTLSGICIVSIISMLTPVTNNLLLLLRDCLNKVLDWMSKTCGL